MIISRRDEGMVVACQGLTGDLVIFLWCYGGGERQYLVLCLNIVRGNTGQNQNGKMGRWQQFSIQREERDRDRRLRKERHRQLQWIKDERRGQRVNFCDPAVLLFCFFFFCWHSEHGGNRPWFFYRSHATSQWSMDAGLLQTYTVEHALCGSAKRGHLGGKRKHPPTQSLPIYPLYCSLTHHATPYTSILLNFSLFPSPLLSLKARKIL